MIIVAQSSSTNKFARTTWQSRCHHHHHHITCSSSSSSSFSHRHTPSPPLPPCSPCRVVSSSARNHQQKRQHMDLIPKKAIIYSPFRGTKVRPHVKAVKLSQSTPLRFPTQSDCSSFPLQFPTSTHTQHGETFPWEMSLLAFQKLSVRVGVCATHARE